MVAIDVICITGIPPIQSTLCFDALRHDLLKPPANGPEIPKSQSARIQPKTPRPEGVLPTGTPGTRPDDASRFCLAHRQSNQQFPAFI